MVGTGPISNEFYTILVNYSPKAAQSGQLLGQKVWPMVADNFRQTWENSDQSRSKSEHMWSSPETVLVPARVLASLVRNPGQI